MMKAVLLLSWICATAVAIPTPLQQQQFRGAAQGLGYQVNDAAVEGGYQVNDAAVKGGYQVNDAPIEGGYQVNDAAVKRGFGYQVTIKSAEFPNVFLRMDGREVDHFTGNGAGVVNCQYGAFPWEKFILNEVEDGVYTIESAAFPNVFLRMDGRGVDHFTGSGAGVVNCQYGAFPWERFRINEVEYGVYTIESVDFPNVFLRMGGGGVDHFTGSGAGVVNCQYGAFPWEKFIIH